MIAELTNALCKQNVDVTAEDVADIIWLALHMNLMSPNQNDNRDIGSEDEEFSPTPLLDQSKLTSPSKNESLPVKEPVAPVYEVGSFSSARSIPLKIPAGRALPNSLEISRALRLLKRRIPLSTEIILDEEATVDLIAKQNEKLWLPVFRPATERLFEIALIVDKGASMNIWQQTVNELQRLLEHHGAFRDVRTWKLDTNSKDDQITLLEGANSLKRHYKEILEPTGRRLILVVTDCVSPAWEGTSIWRILSEWGRSHPVALVQMLPQSLWAGTAISRAKRLRVYASGCGAPNKYLHKESSRKWQKLPLNGTPIPTFTLEQFHITSWAKFITASNKAWNPALLFEEGRDNKEELLDRDNSSYSTSPESRLQKFEANASPTAQRLAKLLAAAAPLSLPVMRLVQQVLLPESQQVHLAEVFLGGLISRTNQIEKDNADEIQYDFFPGIRDLLLDSSLVPSSLKVLSVVSEYLEKHFGQSLDFSAVLANPESLPNLVNDDWNKPFAVVAGNVLSRMGGRYKTFAENLERQQNNTNSKLGTIKGLVLLADPIKNSPLQLSKEREIILSAINLSKHKRKVSLVFSKAATIHDLRRQLLNDDFQIVHFSGHGSKKELIFENEVGEPHLVSHEVAANLLKEYKSIECMILSASDSFSLTTHIFPKTAHIIAMDGPLDDKAAIEFSRGFYDAIAAGKSYEFAYREGCNNVKLIYPDASFSSVFLNNDISPSDNSFIDRSKLSSTEVRSNQSKVLKNSKDNEHFQLKIGIPPLPDVFLRRDRDIEILKERLGLIKGGKKSRTPQGLTTLKESHRNKNSIVVLRGFPGMGKTTLATVLVEDRGVTDAFPDGVLWASLGQSPNLIYTMAKWAEGFGTEGIYRAPTVREAVEQLSDILRKKCLLMIIDDVWQAEHVIPFKQICGKDSSILITTSFPQVANKLSILPEFIHNLSTLTEKDCLKLLDILAPTVISTYPNECLELVRLVDFLPFAIHIMGRLLNEKSREIWNAPELLKSLRKEISIIKAKAPTDLIDLEKQTIPSVSALLKKSVASLDRETQLYFAYLAPFAEKPATFGLDALKITWQVEDPRPIVRQLISLGLLEPVGGGRYQIHSLSIALAQSLLEELSANSEG